MGFIVVENPPAAEPVSLDMAKQFLRVTINDDNQLIETLVQSAREEVESFTARSLVNKGYRQSLDAFPYFIDSMLSQEASNALVLDGPRYSSTYWNYSQMVKLLRSPLREVSKIVYISSADQLAHTLLPAPLLWAPSTDYEIGDQVKDSNGNLQTVTAINAGEENEDGSATSGSSTPSWNATTGATTSDGPLTWTNGGAAPAGDFLFDADSEPPRLFPTVGNTWPPVLYVPNAVQIHFIAGYGASPDDVPARAKVAVMQLAAAMYENREADAAAALQNNPGIQRLLWSLRVWDEAPTRG